MTNETERVLQACFDLTDWSVFEATANNLDEHTETVTSYISFCEDMCIPTRTHLTYNNDKPWFTAKLRQLRQVKEDAYRKVDKVLYKQAKYTLEKEIRVAKRTYFGKQRNKFSSSDYEHLTIMWNTQHYYIIYSSHILIYISNLHISYLYVHNCLYYILCFCFFFVHCLFCILLFFISVSCCCLSVALWSFCHYKKIPRMCKHTWQ